LIQDGFDLPFYDDVLCPASKIFASKELREIGDAVNIGLDGDWLYFNIGNVNIWLRKAEGRFPQMDSFTKDIDGHSWLAVDADDAVFVSERLDILPGNNKGEGSVSIGLDGNVSVRGHDTDKQTVTELRLVRSRYEGENVTVPLNRKYLKNALNFGINRIGINPNERTPLIGYGDKKLFIVMPLDGDEPEVEKVTIIESTAEIAVPSKRKRMANTDKPKRMTQACRTVKQRTSAEPSGKALILDDAVKLRATLHETLDNVNALIRSIKSQRRQDKLLRDTVASLRKLQNI
jgi:DNA polymerase III sliding clamp (beta) subunit (PCNA family)